MTECPECGAECPADATECPNCGCDLTENEIEVEVSVTVPRSALVKGAPERRGVREYELREGKNGLLHFEGYAALWDVPYEVTDRYGTYTEVVERNALSRTLSRNPDVILNVNHSGLPLARSTAGTLRLGTDSRGYIVDADLEPRDPDVQAIRFKLERGDMGEMSWAFRVTKDTWSENDTHRSIGEANVDGGDVSIVNTGANRHTTASLRSMLDQFKHLNLVECRANEQISVDEMIVVRDTLDAAIKAERPTRKTMSIAAAKRALLLD